MALLKPVALLLEQVGAAARSKISGGFVQDLRDPRCLAGGNVLGKCWDLANDDVDELLARCADPFYLMTSRAALLSGLNRRPLRFQIIRQPLSMGLEVLD